MHEDEKPLENALQRARTHHAKGNMEAFLLELSRMKNAEAANIRRRRDLEGELQRLRDGRIRLEEELAQAKQHRDRLEERLLTQTDRVEKYKRAYNELRAIPHLRIAKAVLQPRATLQRMAARRAEAPAQRALATGPAAPAASVSPQTRSGDVRPTEQRTKREGAASGRSDAATIVEAKRQFFVEGDLVRPARVTTHLMNDAHSDPAKGLSRRDRIFLKQLHGLVSLKEQLPLVGPPQPNIGYTPEGSRIMYCAHSTGEFNSNGYSTRTEGLVRALAELGAEVFVVARPGYPWDAKTSKAAPSKQKRFEREVGGVRHVFNPGADWSSDALDVYFQVAADVFAREAIINRPAVVHSASNHVTAIPALMAARRLGIPFVYEVRGFWEITEASAKGDHWLASERFALAVALETIAAKGADRVLAITEEVRDELVRRGVDEAKIEIVPNAADSAEFVPVPPDRALLRQLAINPGQTVVGYAGSLVGYEGLDLLIRAHALTRTSAPLQRLVIVGDGPALGELRALTSELGVERSVRFTGRVEASEVPRYLSVFDVVACPRVSNIITEMVSPLKPLEAMAAGKALLASNVAPLRHLIGDNQQRGVLFEAGNPHSLAEGLIRLGSDEKCREDLGRRARAWAVDERSWMRIASIVLGAHASLVPAESTASSRPLSEHRIGIIADEFTTKSLESECALIPLQPENWREQLGENKLDAVLVESAWEGNGGTWRRKVGFYGDDEFKELREITEHCRALGIPTIFWNKEDPVHFARFIRTAAHFDHVFTTDARCIPQYMEGVGPVTRSVASLAFFAQERLHNPLPCGRPYKHTIAYGGSYYGERYPKRSRELSKILQAAVPFGLTIYDRQVNHPGSPYQFPPDLAPYVEGGLSYDDMVRAYKTHPVHVNVNSVEDSPTMFSRRIMELAASGTPALTGVGAGIETLFGSLLPIAANSESASLLAEYWMSDEAGRNADAWALHRTVYRSHLASHRLAYMLRTAGLQLKVDELPAYNLHLEQLDVQRAQAVCRQSHRPAAVSVHGDADGAAVEMLKRAGIRLDGGRDSPDGSPVAEAWFGTTINDRTLGEDLARSHRIAGATVQQQDHDVNEVGHTLIEPRTALAGQPWLGTEPTPGSSVVAVRKSVGPTEAAQPLLKAKAAAAAGNQTVLLAGHDLKFVRPFVSYLENRGCTVLLDEWSGHATHDEAASRKLLARADFVFCEWSLGNAVWYAANKRPDQRLTVRFHSQEVFTQYPQQTQLTRIDHTVFVGELVRRMAQRKFDYRRTETSVVPNAVQNKYFGESKSPDSRFNIGMVGIVPAQKHFDRALDLLAELRETDSRYRLFVKGKTPADYLWMKNRPEEMAYYEEQQRRIANDAGLVGAVQFDGHGDDMESWYAKIGVVISVSDFESFHLTLADGAAGGAYPVSLAWPGAEHIYPREWLHLSVEEMAASIRATVPERAVWESAGTAASNYVRARFHENEVWERLASVVLGSVQAS